MTDLHPIKVETFDIPGSNNVDPKGFNRHVDTYQRTDFGLYMARGANHPRFGYLESWILPSVHLRVNIFHFRPGVEEEQDYYIDIINASDNGSTLTTRDLYVDLVSLAGQPVQVLDIDELAAASTAGYISAEEVEIAMNATIAAIDGIARNGDNVMQWLSHLGMDLTWAPQVTLMDAES